MRVTISVDSATPQEVYDLTLAFQRVKRDNPLPIQERQEPVVTVAGIALGWRSPAMYSDAAQAVLDEYASIEAERQP